MPVTKSAKKALKTSTRRHEENLLHRAAYKGAIKAIKKAVIAGEGSAAELLSKAQSTLDVAAKRNTIHKNKASRLKSRMAKQIAALTSTNPAKKVEPKKKAAPKKATAKKTVAKPAAKKATPKKVATPKK